MFGMRTGSQAHHPVLEAEMSSSALAVPIQTHLLAVDRLRYSSQVPWMLTTKASKDRQDHTLVLVQSVLLEYRFLPCGRGDARSAELVHLVSGQGHH